MDTACFGSPAGPEMTPTQFVTEASQEYKQKGVLPYCKSCHEVVHVYGVHSTNPRVTERFDHADRAEDADPLDDCVLSNRNPRFIGLHPSGWDDERAAVLRTEFFEEGNLRLAYGFCLAMCRKGNMPAAKFRAMLRRADKKRIWAYADIPVWAVAYILLTLENHSARQKDGTSYEFHFVFNKPGGTSANALWERSAECEIVKIFSNSGKQVEVDDNPYPVSYADFLLKAGDANWMTTEFLQALRV